MRKGPETILLLGGTCGLLSILLLIQYGTLYLYKKDRPVDVPFLSYWGIETVERIEFGQNAGILSRRGKEWVLEVGGVVYHPDPKRLERFLTVLKNTRITLRDEATPQTITWYGLRETDSVWITLVSKGKAQRFLLGGVGPLGTEEYCIAEGKPMIYKLSDSLSFYAVQTVEYWRGLN